MEVRLASRRFVPREWAVKLLAGTAVVAVALAPGLLWPEYFRIVATFVLVGLGLVTMRGYLAAFASFKRRAAPRPKPDGVPWPKVSVLVVAYNEASVLPRTMAAMQHVRYPADRIEFVYVYEKRSTDETERIIKDHAARDARFVPLERDDKRGGKAAACNFGLHRCDGDILLSLDADQALQPDAVERAVRWFLSDPAIACVKGRPLAINAHEGYFALAAKLERDVLEKGDLYMRDVVGGCTFFGGGQAFFRRSLFSQIGAFDEEILIEDVDYSIKIHEAGHRIVVDPHVHTFEEHPAAMAAWWTQRKRWARGWMQITRRYFGRVLGMQRVPVGAKVDLLYTLAFVLVPLSFTLMIPLNAARALGAPLDIRTYVPHEAFWWTLFGITPFVAWGCIWLQDRRDGIRHAWREVAALATIGFYFTCLGFATWSAFLDEFVLRRPSVYVKTAKSGGGAEAARAAGDAETA